MYRKVAQLEWYEGQSAQMPQPGYSGLQYAKSFNPNLTMNSQFSLGHMAARYSKSFWGVVTGTLSTFSSTDFSFRASLLLVVWEFRGT